MTSSYCWIIQGKIIYQRLDTLLQTTNCSEVKDLRGLLEINYYNLGNLVVFGNNMYFLIGFSIMNLQIFY